MIHTHTHTQYWFALECTGVPNKVNHECLYTDTVIPRHAGRGLRHINLQKLFSMKAKRQYTLRIKGHFTDDRDAQRLCQGRQAFTDYNGRMTVTSPQAWPRLRGWLLTSEEATVSTARRPSEALSVREGQ